MLSAGTWVTEAVPSASFALNVSPGEVSCASPTSCLFVGAHSARQRGPYTNLAEAWNGVSWRVVAATGPAGVALSALDDVACPATTFCLAVGFAGSARRSRDTAYTWRNDAAWQRISAPTPAWARASQLTGLACFSASACMAVGAATNHSGRYRSFAARWHDGRWTLLTTPPIRGQRDVIFQGIACPTSTRCMAVGNTDDNSRAEYYHAFAETWSRGRWHISTLRSSPSVFSGVSCPAQSRCFATGYTYPPRATYANPLVETWNGRAWSTQHAAFAPRPYNGDVLAHVSCVTTSDCEAVGYRYEPNRAHDIQTLAERWNGRRWILQTTTNP